MKKFPFSITGIASRIGQLVPIGQWAERIGVPHRKNHGQLLTGEDIKNILGLNSKSWDPKLFRDFATVKDTAERALWHAGLEPDQIDLAAVVTCTPYEVMLDQDSFRLFRALGLPDDVVPLQLGAGCAGLIRAASIASQTHADRLLVVAYNVPSLYMLLDDDVPNPAYIANETHRLNGNLWASPAIFSDGVAAMVFERSESEAGRFFYSRDSQSFGDGPGFESPLVTYEGGGAWHPPGSDGCAELSAFAMVGDKVKEYYLKGMLLNHASLLNHRPAYLDEIKRIYVHQSSPALVNAFVHESGIDPDLVAIKAAAYGNLVSASTMRLLDEDVASGRIQDGDEICISVVGAGPERGALICRVATGDTIAAQPTTESWRPAASP